MLINGTNRFGEITIHLVVFNIEWEIIVVDDPREDRVLGKVIVGSVGGDVDKVEILNVGDFPIRPHVHNIS